MRKILLALLLLASAAEAQVSPAVCKLQSSPPSGCGGGLVPRINCYTDSDDGLTYHCDGTSWVSKAATTTGNAGTASALASDPTNCVVSGEFPKGIAANGDAQNCTAVSGGSGDVVGPASSIDGIIPSFNGTTGKALFGRTLGPRVGVNGGFEIAGPNRVSDSTDRLSFGYGSTELGAVSVGQSATGYNIYSSPGNGATRKIVFGVYGYPELIVDYNLFGIAVNAFGVMGFLNTFNNADAPVDAAFTRKEAKIIKVTDGSTGGGTIQVGDPGTKPTCAVGYRGTLWVDAGGAGVADTVEICTKDGSDTYGWRTLPN